MKYKLHIAYKNRPDLTMDAIKSTREIGNLHLWPNGDAPDFSNEFLAEEKVTVRRLPEMSPVDVINMMIQSSWEDDIMFWAHNDCFCQPGAAVDFFNFVKGLHEHHKSDWGVCYGLYDILCAFNMTAVRKVGYWDPMFFQYTADPDYYHRLTIAGFPPIQGPGHEGPIEHRGSMTVRSDPTFNRRVQWREKTKFDKSYYAMKWGGLPGAEKFAKPFQEFR